MNYLDLLKLNLSFKNTFENINNINNTHTENIYLSECATNLSKMLASYLFNQKKQNIIYITPSIYEASKAYEVMCDIAGTDNVSFFPVEEFISSELVATSESFRLARMLTIEQILNKVPQIIVTNVEGYTHQIIKKEKLEESILKLKVNDIYSRDKLVHELVIRGYKKVATTSTSGTFSVRGSLIDVYPINEQTPIRIYYFDDEIESVKKINVETQMSSGSVNEITIYPLYEMFYDEKEIEKIVKRIKSKNIITEKIQRDIESIENYQNLDQLYTYLPDICEEYQPFYQLIENNICIYEDYASCLEHEKAMNVEISDYFTINKRHINKDFFVTLQQALYFARLNIFTSVFRSSLVDIKLDQHIPLNTSNCYEYNNNIRTMLEDIKLNKEKTYLITHIDDKKLKFIEETFNSNQIDFKRIDDVTEIKKGRTYISVMPNGYGFEDLEANFSIITPNEFAPGKIIKSSKYQKFLKDTTKIYNKEELNPGDYVVHQEYGIGKYLVPQIMLQHLRRSLMPNGTDIS